MVGNVSIIQGLGAIKLFIPQDESKNLLREFERQWVVVKQTQHANLLSEGSQTLRLIHYFVCKSMSDTLCIFYHL